MTRPFVNLTSLASCPVSLKGPDSSFRLLRYAELIPVSALAPQSSQVTLPRVRGAWVSSAFKTQLKYYAFREATSGGQLSLCPALLNFLHAAIMIWNSLLKNLLGYWCTHCLSPLDYKFSSLRVETCSCPSLFPQRLEQCSKHDVRCTNTWINTLQNENSLLPRI